MKRVLLVCRHDDPHAPLIQRSLDLAGVEHCTLRLGLDFHEYRLHIGPRVATLACGDQVCDLGLVRNSFLVYLPFAVDRMPLVEGCSGFAAREWDASMRSIFDIWGRENREGWLIDPAANMTQNAKPMLLYMAGISGAELPVWQISQNIGLDAVSEIVGKAINSWQQVDEGS